MVAPPFRPGLAEGGDFSIRNQKSKIRNGLIWLVARIASSPRRCPSIRAKGRRPTSPISILTVPHICPGLADVGMTSIHKSEIENQKYLVTLERDLRHRQRSSNLLNLVCDIEGVVYLMHATLPMSVSRLFPAAFPNLSPSPCVLWDFCVLRAFLWDLWDNRGWGCTPRKPPAKSPKAKDVILSAAKDLCIASRTPSVGFLRFTGFFVGRVGNRGWGWDVWQLSTQHSELSTQHSELVYQLTNYIAQLSTVFPQVTWA